jgi:hypothetical protein
MIELQQAGKRGVRLVYCISHQNRYGIGARGGCKKLDTGYWIHDTRCRRQDKGQRMKVKRTGCWMQDTRCWIHDAGYWI